MDSKTADVNRNRILLEETFYVLTKKNCTFKVRLTLVGLSLIKESNKHIKEQLISIHDIIGARCFRSKKQTGRCVCQSIQRSNSLEVVEDNSFELDETDSSAYLYIYAYILQNSKGGTQKRERTIITLRFRSFDKYEDNYREAQKWRTAIKKLMRGENVTNTGLIEFVPTHKYIESRRLLILCNPKSGAGKGKQIFQQKVAPILQEAEIPFDLVVTKRINFAREYVRTNNLSQWTSIVVVSNFIYFQIVFIVLFLGLALNILHHLFLLFQRIIYLIISTCFHIILCIC